MSIFERRNPITVIAVMAMVVLSIFAVSQSFASTSIDNVKYVEVQQGDTYTKIAQQLAPTASSTDVTSFAHYLARANGGTNNTSIISTLTVDRILEYNPTRVPGPAATTTTTTQVSTTTAPSTTTTTLPATTTTQVTTTTAAPTTTTQPATTTTVASGGPACGLPSAAFCDTFDSPYTGTKTQTGDLDPTIWGVSRLANVYPDGNVITPTHNRCDPSNAVLPPADIRICNGQLVESLNDGGAVANQDLYPKQPFDFTGRTGTVVFDVSADSEGIHAAWPEFVITDTPVPGVASIVGTTDADPGDSAQHAANEIGFVLAGCGGGNFTTTGVSAFFWTVNGAYHQQAPRGTTQCIRDGSPSAMNHFKVQVSTTHMDVYATDGGSTTFKLIASFDVPGGLAFSQGLVWMADEHYNAAKNAEFNPGGGQQADHSFTWDNLGFDGPKTYRDLGFDVPYNTASGNNSNGQRGQAIAYQVNGSKNFTVSGVNWSQQPKAARIVLNAYGSGNLSVSINGHASQSLGQAVYGWNSYTVALPASDAVQGTNTITISGNAYVTNISLIMVAGAPVP